MAFRHRHQFRRHHHDWLEAEAEGEMAVPLEQLADLVRHFPAEAEITIAADDRAATVTSGKSGSSCRCFRSPICRSRISSVRKPAASNSMPGSPATCFQAGVRGLGRRSRPYLRGIFLHNNGDNLVAVAADGFRLCRVTTPATTTLSTDRSLIIPNEMVKTINRLLGNASGNVTLRRSERLFSVEGAGFTLVSTRVDATYPEYERLIPCEGPNVVTVSRAALSECLARFAAVAGPEVGTPVVSLRWDAGGLHLRR